MMKRSPLDILAYAISDVGLWTWWAAELPNYVQLEFDRTMLYLPTKEANRPPNNRIAIQFGKLISVSVIIQKDNALPSNWLELFQEDKLNPFQIDYEHFSFELAEILAIAEQAHHIETIHGYSFNSVDFGQGEITLGFWAEGVGCIVSAEKYRIVSIDGEIPLERIPELHSQWWEYWNKYWKVKDTSQALPYDPLCEITIPATEENIKTITDNINQKEE
jgi:hypothetical protein